MESNFELRSSGSLFSSSEDIIGKRGKASESLVLENDTQITIQEWKQNEALNELLHTEKDFLRDISILKTVFVDPCLKSAVLPETKSRTIFLDIAGIIQSTRKIVGLLENSCNNRQNLISTIIEIFSSPVIFQCTT
jgi:hypothetical protein